MNKDILIGIDGGTSVMKAIAFDLDGRQLAMTSAPNSYDDLGNGAVVQDADRTWRDAAAVLRQMHDRIDNLAERTVAIGVTGQGDGTWLIDAAGRPVGPAWLWLDSRAADIVDEMEASGARAETYKINGCGLNACQQSVQLAWMQRHTPDVLEQAVTGFHCKDWLYFQLTGERVTDVSEATFTFGNFRTRTYAEELLEAVGISKLRRLLPEAIDGSVTTHPLSKTAAEITGFATGTPVSLGYIDIICTSLGGGLYAPGQAVGCSVVGTTSIHMRLWNNPEDVELLEEPSGYLIPFPVPGHLAQLQSNMAGTINIDWIVDRVREAASLLGHEVSRKQALMSLDARVLDAVPGSVLYHPYIHEAGERGPFVDPAARAQFMGLSTKVGTMDLMRGVYEGLAFAAVDCFGAMGEVPREVRIAGGAARSKSLKKIMASAIGVPIRETNREEAGAAGAAMIAAVAIGHFSGMAACARQWVDPTIGDIIEPDEELHRLYARRYTAYLHARHACRPIWRELSS